MRLFYTTIFTLLLSVTMLNAQSYFNGKFRIEAYDYGDRTFTLYDFSREGSSATNLKAKYFATNAYDQYLNWKSGKEILFITAGAFSDGWDSSAKPVGICVDNGHIVNRSPQSEMDGMVIVYNGAAQQGGIAVVDMDKKYVNVENPYGSGNYEQYDPRDNITDRTKFLNWGEDAGVTLFQTQLVYSEKKTYDENFGNKFYGAERERRYLAICIKNGIVHHVVVDVPEAIYLGEGAEDTKVVLEYDGFKVLYILNLDTGDKNLMYSYNGSYLEDKRPYKGSNTDAAKIENATNLLIYYKD
ncbi:hypothetical protein [Gilvibacter sediminis]|uniref:hypothetical protein n=1 Tax=Gilvibacter sediminis TaxID=379071 RepID=UPI0023508319|nr:hypothetical protein [Gilvibacter sediminis]MDC7996663.1 hypothetical protein [Gilvibacter sediminis]